MVLLVFPTLKILWFYLGGAYTACVSHRLKGDSMHFYFVFKQKNRQKISQLVDRLDADTKRWLQIRTNFVIYLLTNNTDSATYLSLLSTKPGIIYAMNSL